MVEEKLEETDASARVMDERGPVSRDELRQTDMFIRSLFVKVPVALLSCPSFVYTSWAKCVAYDLSGVYVYSSNFHIYTYTYTYIHTYVRTLYVHKYIHIYIGYIYTYPILSASSTNVPPANTSSSHQKEERIRGTRIGRSHKREII